MNMASIATGADPNPSARGESRNTMPNRILHQRLKQQTGNLRPEGFGRYIPNYFESISELYFLNFEIAVDKLQFPAQGGDLGSRAIQAHSQQVTEPRHHPVSSFHVG